jgi:hypothetical protein
MTKLEITCVRYDDTSNVITHVGVGAAGKEYRVIDIVQAMLNGDTFHTFRGGQWAKVYRNQHNFSGRWFLTTNPDDMNENDLDFLPICKSSYT